MSEFKPGQKVSCLVPWPNGQNIRMEGTLITIKGNDAYIESVLGPVSGDADTLELEEDAK